MTLIVFVKILPLICISEIAWTLWRWIWYQYWRYLYYYSQFVTHANFTHRPLTTMFGVSIDPLWPTDQRLIASFGVPASGGLQRLSKAGRGRNFFWAQTVPFDLSINPWWFLPVSGPQNTPAASRLLKASAKFFLFQTVPLDLSVNP